MQWWNAYGLEKGQGASHNSDAVFCDMSIFTLWPSLSIVWYVLKVPMTALALHNMYIARASQAPEACTRHYMMYDVVWRGIFSHVRTVESKRYRSFSWSLIVISSVLVPSVRCISSRVFGLILHFFYVPPVSCRRVEFRLPIRNLRQVATGWKQVLKQI